MRRTARWVFGVIVLVVAMVAAVPGGADQATESAATSPSALSPAQIAQISANSTQAVIILLANQHPEQSGAGGQFAARSSALASDQQPIIQELQSVNAQNIHPYQFLNAIAATTSAAEVARLQANPNVAAVVPDASQTPTVTTPRAPQTSSSPSVTPSLPSPICPSNPAVPLLEPEALQTMSVNFGPGATKPAANDLATGRGVKIAVFPDGLDPNIPDFIRGGQSVIFDYRDFSGTGPNGQTGGVEAFGDVSSIASQGNQTFDLSQYVNPAHPLPPGCNIRIQGVAPDASVAVMKLFGSGQFLDSVVLQALEWAVMVDHVDILSQSFGLFRVPDPGADPVSLFDQDAIAAGLVVVNSTGDSGPANTIASPATNPGVIRAGATTTYQLYAQLTQDGFQLGSGGFLDNEIAPLSSAGLTDFGPRTVDVVAPGDENWVDCSTNTATFTGCANGLGGQNLGISGFAGTSEAAPLIAGTAALVIQAYRDTHGGASPTPALVTQILMSSAQHLNSRADLQGAGLVNALRAVQTARSIKDSNGSPPPAGHGLLYSPNSITLTAAPGTARNVPITVTNTGTTGVTLDPTLRVLGTPTTLSSGTLTLNPGSDPTFVDQAGITDHDVHFVNFNVPSGTDRLLARIGWQVASQPGTVENDSLFDPAGNLVSFDGPEGSSGFGQSEVHDPTPGTWTMVTFDTSSTPYSGPLNFTVTGTSFTTVANGVLPGERIIPPGGSAPFSIIVTTPSTAGDLAESVVFGTLPGDAPRASIPVTLRSTVPVHNGVPGSFSGEFTGGNGRQNISDVQAVQFDVPPSMKNVNANVTIGADGYGVLGFLVDPNAMPVDIQQNLQPSVGALRTLHLTMNNPAPGRWSLVLAVLNPNLSGLTSTTFTGTIDFTTASVTASGLPISSSITLPPGQPSTATVKVTNTGNFPERFSVDPRQNITGTLGLPVLLNQATNLPLPVPSTAFPVFPVPPFSTRFDVGVTGTVPMLAFLQHQLSFPEAVGGVSGTSAAVSLSAPDLPQGLWFGGASEVGPFNGPAPSSTYSVGADAVTNLFDPTVTSSTGNPWSLLLGLTNTYTPLLLSPGQSGSITVTITPQAPSGTVVSGFLAVETETPFPVNSDIFATFPYTYTVG